MAREKPLSRGSFVYFVPAGGMGNASARWRVYCYLPYLRQHGVRWHVGSYTYHKFDRPGGAVHGLARLWLELLPVRNLIAFLRADTLFFQKKAIVPWMVRWGHRFGKRIVYDFDDAIYYRPPESAAHAHEHALEEDEFSPRLQWMLRQADVTLVSTPELARFAEVSARKVMVLPTVVHECVQKPSVPLMPPVIGWAGAPENQRYLRTIEAALLQVQKERPEAEVWIITSRLMDPPPRFRYRFIPWSRAAEAEYIPQFTVGIAPLADDPWCRAKMNFKALIYMSYGVPAVVSPGGFPEAEFQHGSAVLVARTEEDWTCHLLEMLSNPARRDEIAAGGLEVVRRHYSAQARVGDFVAALRGSKGRGASPAPPASGDAGASLPV